MELPQLDYLPTVPVALRRAVELHGDRDFVVMPDRRLSFRQAEAASRRVAKQLVAAGVGKGSRVAIQYANSPEWIVAFFAVTRIGAIGIPLSTAYKPAELRKALKHSDAQVLVIPPTMFGDDHLAYVEKALPSLADRKEGDGLMLLPEAPYLRTVLVSGDTDRAWGRSISLAVDADGDDVFDHGITDAHLEAMEAEVAPADWVMLVYTSGTTADPKGVIHSHGTWIRHNDNLSKFIGVTPESKTFGGMPWFWIGGLGLGVGNALCRGFALVCLEKFDPAVALDLIVREKPVAIGMWPQLLQRFREYIVSTGVDITTVPGFIPPPGGPVDPGLRHNSLGQTESFGPHTAGGPEAARVLPEELRGSFGLRVPHIEHKIVDPETNQEQPEGVEGELKVRGYSISQGLYKRERWEAFDEDGWLHTGDKCHFKGPYLFFSGRISEMIKTSGSNVAPREVELTLEAYPEVALAVVLGVPDERRGEAVGVVLVPAPGTTVDIPTIRARAYDELSNYKVPSRYLVLGDHELPILGNGKPDKIKLRELLATVPDQHH